MDVKGENYENVGLNVTDLTYEVNKMLNKVDSNGVTRRERLLDIIWKLIIDTNGDHQLTKVILEYAGGKAVTSDKLQKEDDLEDSEGLLDIPGFVGEIENELQNKQTGETVDETDGSGLQDLNWGN